MLAYVIFYIFSAQARLLSPRCTLIFKRIMPCHVCGNWMGPPGVPPWAFPVVFPSWPYLHQSPNGCWLWSERCGGWICLCTMVCYRKWCRADLHHRQSTGGGWGERLLLNNNIFIFIYIYIYISGLVKIRKLFFWRHIYIYIYIYISVTILLDQDVSRELVVWSSRLACNCGLPCLFSWQSLMESGSFGFGSAA